MHGVLVSKEEVLRALGDPLDWARGERKIEFERRLRPGEQEPDIAGINSYLAYLHKSLTQPLGVDTGLVSEERNQEIWQIAVKEIKDEIYKYEQLLRQLTAS